MPDKFPYPSEHSARLRDPKDFDPESYKRKNGGTIYGKIKVPKTIAIIWAKLKGKSKPKDPPIPQSLRFPIKNWTVEKAKKWLKNNNIKPLKFEPASKNDKESLAQSYDCECIKCGHKETYKDHCSAHKCPKCGGQMRRAERPGPGQEKHAESIPKAALRFREEEPIEILTLKEGEKTKKRRFSMIAHSGKIMLNHWCWGNFAIDLSGVSIGRRKNPALRDHNSERIVGWTEDINIDRKKGIIADGIFSEKTEDGKLALDLADEGFPWQASIYIPPLLIEKVAEGEEAEVNGQKLKGPGTIFRKSILREVSFCALGADENTSASALKNKGDNIYLDVEIIEDQPKKEGDEMKFSELTLDVLKEQRSDLVDEISGAAKEEGLKEGKEIAAKEERQRIANILKEAKTFEKMEDLANELIENGATVEEAIQKFKDKKLKDLENAAPKSPGPNDNLEAEKGKGNLSVEQKAEKEWEKSSELQKEFPAKSTYVSFKKAEAKGAVSILRSK